MNVFFFCRLLNINNVCSVLYWVYEVFFFNDSLDMDKKEKIIILLEVEWYYKLKINKLLIIVLILGKFIKDRREYLKYGNWIYLEFEYNDKMMFF